MAIVVDGHPADVHTDLSRDQGPEFLFPAGKRVIDYQHRIFLTQMTLKPGAQPLRPEQSIKRRQLRPINAPRQRRSQRHK